nr:MAG TPA: hypothetical protein [Caudoviricetes sp.]
MGVQGFSFLSGNVSATRKRLQWLFFRPCNYTATTPKAFIGLYGGVSADFTHSSAHNTAAKQAAYIPPAPRRKLHSSEQPPYYNKVYKGASLLWIHARRRNIPQTMPAAARPVHPACIRCRG